jgi:hypothetical protein
MLDQISKQSHLVVFDKPLFFYYLQAIFKHNVFLQYVAIIHNFQFRSELSQPQL